MTTLNVPNQFDFWSAAPVDSTATHEQIAEATKLPVQVVQRTLDHAMTVRGTLRARSPRPARWASTGRCRPYMMLLPEALSRFAAGRAEVSKNHKETCLRPVPLGRAVGRLRELLGLFENDGESERKGWRQRNFIKFMAYTKHLFMTVPTDIYILKALVPVVKPGTRLVFIDYVGKNPARMRLCRIQ
ncbi:hypothetical protein PpBr36_01346 [Pyricularia pennisetigena]|uniref:hypothetical protein n=1 Tax=Pyricularia pennisetigena TaxID=1578925 RepID=UPI00114DDF0F|nr:hypothetical protein PpBr36_01346 [Pyricularia pennisetigena]TLS29532.1 hypothetical protein PpBr36_01346 [Pyricularia pennisetigena]